MKSCTVVSGPFLFFTLESSPGSFAPSLLLLEMKQGKLLVVSSNTVNPFRKNIYSLLHLLESLRSFPGSSHKIRNIKMNNTSSSAVRVEESHPKYHPLPSLMLYPLVTLIVIHLILSYTAWGSRWNTQLVMDLYIHLGGGVFGSKKQIVRNYDISQIQGDSFRR